MREKYFFFFTHLFYFLLLILYIFIYFNFVFIFIRNAILFLIIGILNILRFIIIELFIKIIIFKHKRLRYLWLIYIIANVFSTKRYTIILPFSACLILKFILLLIIIIHRHSFLNSMTLISRKLIIIWLYLIVIIN